MSTTEFNPYFPENDTYDTVVPQVGDFTPFYIAIAIGTVILGSIIILNIICCCSRYSEYWLDRHTGNRYLVSIWTATAHKQPPLDITELERYYQPVHYVHPFHDSPEDYHDIKEQSVAQSFSQQPLTASQEYLELQKRESDI